MTMTTGFLIVPCTTTLHINEAWKRRSLTKHSCSQLVCSKFVSSVSSCYCPSEFSRLPYPCLSSHGSYHGRLPSSRPYNIACVSSSSSQYTSSVSTRLYVSGLSFRTTQESLRNAFEKFGQLVDVNLVMDKIANRPRGFAFLRYETEEEARNAIEGMHGKFLDGRVIFVEVARPRSETRQNQQNLGESQQ